MLEYSGFNVIGSMVLIIQYFTLSSIHLYRIIISLRNIFTQSQYIIYIYNIGPISNGVLS